MADESKNTTADESNIVPCAGGLLANQPSYDSDCGVVIEGHSFETKAVCRTLVHVVWWADYIHVSYLLMYHFSSHVCRRHDDPLAELRTSQHGAGTKIASRNPNRPITAGL